MPDILDTIRELMKTHVDQEKEPPNALRVSSSDEYEFLTLAMDRLPDDVAKKLFVKGPRKAFERLWGMKVTWDADKTEVLTVKPNRKR